MEALGSSETFRNYLPAHMSAISPRILRSHALQSTAEYIDTHLGWMFTVHLDFIVTRSLDRVGKIRAVVKQLP
jgi:hypothetical protein